MSKKVTLLKTGHRLAVTPPNEQVYALLEPHLRYTAKRVLYGEERQYSNSNIELQDYDLFIYNVNGELVCPFGLYNRIRRVLRANGYRFKMKDLRPHPRPEVFIPDWDRVFRFGELRYGQDKFILKAAAHHCGRFSCPPGYGKSWTIAMQAQAFPQATIDVVAADAAVARKLHDDLLGMMPGVGLIGAGSRSRGKRVQVYCAYSLHHSTFKADLLFADEVHQLGADCFAEMLARYQNTRMFGFSATHDMRADQKNLRIEAVFGPILFELSYRECVDRGLIVPLQVIWRPVVMDDDPCEGMGDTQRLRYGIWRNRYRNRMIAADACQFLGKGEQILVTARTIEHLVHLKREFTELGVNIPLIYSEAGMEPRERKKYIKWGLIDNDEPRMTVHLRKQYEEDFKAGKIEIAACNSVWDTGMDFPKLTVLLRADAMASPTLDTQIPGRTSRIAEDKESGLILDYMDQFNRYFRNKALDRSKGYQRNEWDEIYPEKPKSLFRQTYLFS